MKKRLYITLAALLPLGACTSTPNTEHARDSASSRDETDIADAGDTEEDTNTEASMDTEPVVELCEVQDEVDVLDGEYRIHNNVWGRGEGVGEQCITVQGTGFEVTLSTHNSQSVAAYPFILKGCHLGGTCTKDSGMPIQVSTIHNCGFHWKIDESTADGQYNVAYESWFSTTSPRRPRMRGTTPSSGACQLTRNNSTSAS